MVTLPVFGLLQFHISPWLKVSFHNLFHRRFLIRIFLYFVLDARWRVWRPPALSFSVCTVRWCCHIFRVPLDAPEAPENLQASDVHADHLKLSWLPPSDDGGSDITGRLYIVLLCHISIVLIHSLNAQSDLFFCCASVRAECWGSVLNYYRISRLKWLPLFAAFKTKYISACDKMLFLLPLVYSTMYRSLCWCVWWLKNSMMFCLATGLPSRTLGQFVLNFLIGFLL